MPVIVDTTPPIPAPCPDADEIQRALGVMFNGQAVVELRTIRSAQVPQIRRGYFTDHAALVAAAVASSSDDATACYVTLNQLRPELANNATNGLASGSATRDVDIARRRWLLVDVDPDREANSSATDTEKTAAHRTMDAVADWLHQQGFPEPVAIDSGNGFHLLYAIDLDNTLAARFAVQQFLAELADRFDTESAKVDQSVFNAGRITKLPGTVARKGQHTAERPHRVARLLSVPSQRATVSLEQLQRIIGGSEPAPQPATPDTPACTTRLDVPEFLERYDLEYTHNPGYVTDQGPADLYELHECPWADEHTTGPAGSAVFQFASGATAFTCRHSHCVGRTWADFRQRLAELATDNLIVNMAVCGAHDPSSIISGQPNAPDMVDEPVEDECQDPGPMPLELLRIPGFVSAVMDYCLSTAPYPNPTLAFCGAMALQAALAGRKVQDSGGTRTNIYLLGLANSGAGKDWPRQLNKRVLFDAGAPNMLGEKFASGEGLQDALFMNNSMLFQTDEIDALLQSINKSRDGRMESLQQTLLELYSSANTVYPMRSRAMKFSRADKEPAGNFIDQPNLVIFGTAIPQHYYAAMSERMLTNGLFARMMVVEAGRRSEGQEAVIIDPPGSIMDVARWWVAFEPFEGNMNDQHPQAIIVGCNNEAREMLREAQRAADTEYTQAESRNNSVGCAVWARLAENTRKLALLYAVSAHHEAPRIDAAAVSWATAFANHLIRRMLFMAAANVADNPYSALMLKLMDKLRNARDRELPHSVLLKRMDIDARSFDDLISTLEQRRDVETVRIPRAGTPQRFYRLL